MSLLTIAIEHDSVRSRSGNITGRKATTTVDGVPTEDDMRTTDLIRLATALVAIAGATPAYAQGAGLAQFAVPGTGGGGSNTLVASTFPAHTIVMDASSGNIAFPLPSSMRSFATHSDFATFLQQNLNATPIYASDGRVIGVAGSLLQVGNAYYVDSNYNVQTITEPISAFIGGLQGTFSVAGTTYTTALQGQESMTPATANSSPPSAVAHCNSSGECIGTRSWNDHWIFHLKDDVGISVEQVTQGYQLTTWWCNGFVESFGICRSFTGQNTLTLQGTIFYDPYKVYGFGPSITQVAWRLPPTTRSNVARIAFNQYAVYFGTGDPTGLSDASVEIGACSRGTSALVPSWGGTADGSTLSGDCFGGGVTCNAGYTSCPGNYNICANLSSDPANCGACGNACQSGWSCASGACQPPPCPAGQTLCSGACVSLSSNIYNCGSCGNVCPTVGGATRTCSSATCGFACNTGYYNCGDFCTRNGTLCP